MGLARPELDREDDWRLIEFSGEGDLFLGEGITTTRNFFEL